MRFFCTLFLWAFIPYANSSPYQVEPWAFDETSSSSESWSLDDSSSLLNSDLGGESTSSMFMAYDDGNTAMDTTLLAENDLSNGEELSELDESHPEDDLISMAISSLDDISLALEAGCGDSWQYRSKRRGKRGVNCKNPPATSTEKKPDGTGPSPPSPGGPSFFPGYGSYIMDKKTNILRIPGFVPRLPGENDVCLIYTEGYLPYGVCGTELFNSVDNFWGIETYTITKAQLAPLGPFYCAYPGKDYCCRDWYPQSDFVGRADVCLPFLELYLKYPPILL